MTEPWDSGHLDAINELKESPGYALVVERIQETLEQLRNDLEKGASDSTRGQCKALRMVLTIPEILKSEIQASLKDPSK